MFPIRVLWSLDARGFSMPNNLDWAFGVTPSIWTGTRDGATPASNLEFLLLSSSSFARFILTALSSWCWLITGGFWSSFECFACMSWSLLVSKSLALSLYGPSSTALVKLKPLIVMSPNISFSFSFCNSSFTSSGKEIHLTQAPVQSLHRLGHSL